MEIHDSTDQNSTETNKKREKKITLILFCTKSHHPWTRETSQIGFAQIQSDQRNFPYFSIHTSTDCSFSLGQRNIKSLWKASRKCTWIEHTKSWALHIPCLSLKLVLCLSTAVHAEVPRETQGHGTWGRDHYKNWAKYSAYHSKHLQRGLLLRKALWERMKWVFLASHNICLH